MYSPVTSRRHQLILVILAAFAVFVDGIDCSIVNVAMPVMTADFGIDISLGAWIVMAYGLFLAGFILAFGRLAENGRIQKIFILGFAVFSFGSLLCALAPTFAVIVTARAVQGVGAAMIAAVSPLIIVKFLPEHKHGFGMGVIATTGGLALTLGPSLGGIITTLLSWHWVFLINLPLGIIAIVLSRIYIPHAESKPVKTPFDWTGMTLLFVAIASCIILLERFGSLGFGSPAIIVLLAVFLLSAGAYIVYSLKCRFPLINVRIFRHWKFTFVAISYLLTCMVFAGVMYLLPYYLEIPLGISPGEAGLLLIISSIITALVGIPTGMWADRIGCRVPCILAAVCRITFCALMFIIKPEWGVIAVIPVLVFMGLSFGISGGPATTRIVQNSPKGEEGSGTSIMITTDYLGGVVGVAAYTLVFALVIPESIGVAVAELPTALFVDGFHATALFGIAIGITTLILSAVVPNIIVKRKSE